MHIPVILALLFLTSVAQSHDVRQVIRRQDEEEEEQRFDSPRRKLWERLLRPREHLQQESPTDFDIEESELGDFESAQRALGSELESGNMSIRLQDGRIRSVMAKGSMDDSEEPVEWIEGDSQDVDREKTVREAASGIANENLDTVIDSEGGEDYEDSSEIPQPKPPKANCSHCWIREEQKRLRIEAIRQQILQKLRLKAPPNITRQQLPHIPSRHPLHSRLLARFGMKEKEDEDPFTRLGSEIGREDMYGYEDYYVNTQKSINFGETPPPRFGNSSQICYFTFKDDVMKARVVRATLWVHIRQGQMNNNAQALLLIYIRHPPAQRGGAPTRTFYKSKRIHPPPRGATWQHFDIRPIVSNWTSRPETNYGLDIEATDSRGKMLPIVIPANQHESTYKPFVEVKIRDAVSNRHKRMLKRMCEEGDMERNCCRFPLRISFEDFGWDWVIAPKSYTANYCSGECPYVYAQDYQHTHLVQQAVPRNATICCSPRKMHALSMIYFADATNVVYGKVPEMVVDVCGCA